MLSTCFRLVCDPLAHATQVCDQVFLPGFRPARLIDLAFTVYYMANLVSWSADDGGEHFTRRVVTGEASLAHVRSVVNHQRSHFIVRHLTSVAVIVL